MKQPKPQPPPPKLCICGRHPMLCQCHHELPTRRRGKVTDDTAHADTGETLNRE